MYIYNSILIIVKYEGVKMISKNITLRVNSEVYEKYKLFCKNKGWLISRQFEIMMEDQMKDDKNGR